MRILFYILTSALAGLFNNLSAAVKISYCDQLPSHSQAIIKQIAVDISSIEASEITRKTISELYDKHSSFWLCSLTLKEALDQRLLWLSGDVHFSDGSKHDVQFEFHAIEQGTYIDISKYNGAGLSSIFGNGTIAEPVEFHIKSIVLK